MAGLLNQVGIPFFLMQGTCLGAYRDRGFTPTERDIDLGCLREDLTEERVWRLLQTLVGSGFDVEVVVRPFDYVRTIVALRRSVKFDIVSFAKYKDKRFAACPEREWLTEPYCIVHEAEMLENYRTVNLFSYDFWVPREVEKYLELEYGPDWRTPREDHISRTRVYDFVKQEGLGCA